MPNDSESRLPPPPHVDLWTLPKIVELKIERVTYRMPRKHVIAGKLIELSEGIEIVVKTDGAIPVRALSPALYVGSVEVAENEQIDATRHRFFVFDEERLEAGSPITLGWAGHPVIQQPSTYRYQPPRSRRRAED